MSLQKFVATFVSLFIVRCFKFCIEKEKQLEVRTFLLLCVTMCLILDETLLLLKRKDLQNLVNGVPSAFDSLQAIFSYEPPMSTLIET